MHNIDLPRHRYVHVLAAAVLRDGNPDATVPAIWWGMSATPGRMFGCHVLLENGAIIVDLPLHVLRHRAEDVVPWHAVDAQRWNAYGPSLEAHEPAYLTGLPCHVLTPDHAGRAEVGHLWFYLDHVADGFSLEPAQHKHHWVVALANGAFTCVPQDMLLVEEPSFTEVTDIPPVRRQEVLWSCE